MVDAPSWTEIKDAARGRRGAYAFVVIWLLILTFIVIDVTIGFLVVLLIPVAIVAIVIGLLWLGWTVIRK